MRVALRGLHCWLSLAAGFGCLLVAQWTGPAVMLALFIVGCGLMLDGVTTLWARSGSTGGLSDHRQ